jgi:hypothetical protein
MKTRTCLLIPLFLATLASTAVAVPLFPEIRPRAGVGFEPDEFVVGAQVFMRGRLGGLVRIAPSLDFGFGSDLSTILINGDLLTGVLPVGSRFGLYGGAGLAAAWFIPDQGDSQSEIGVNLVLGADIGNRFYAETRFGLDQMPDFRLLGGIRFVK